MSTFPIPGCSSPTSTRARFSKPTRMMSTDLRRVIRLWLGLLNMILAMATSATYSSHLTPQQRAAKSGVFFLRALGLCESQMRSGGSLETGNHFYCHLSHWERGHALLTHCSAAPSPDEPTPTRNGEANTDLEYTRNSRQNCLSTWLTFEGCT